MVDKLIAENPAGCAGDDKVLVVIDALASLIGKYALRLTTADDSSPITFLL